MADSKKTKIPASALPRYLFCTALIAVAGTAVSLAVGISIGILTSMLLGPITGILVGILLAFVIAISLDYKSQFKLEKEYAMSGYALEPPKDLPVPSQIVNIDLFPKSHKIDLVSQNNGLLSDISIISISNDLKKFKKY